MKKKTEKKTQTHEQVYVFSLQINSFHKQSADRHP